MDKLKNIRGAIFDLDGTLLDSMHVWEDIDVKFLAARGIEVPSDYAHAIRSMGFFDTAEYTIKRFGFNETPEALMREWLNMAQYAYAHEIELKSGAMEYLKYLHGNKVKLAVATSSSPDLFVPALERCGVANMFSVAVTTEEVGCGKHSPDVYVRAAQKSGLCPCECAVFEDIAAGLRSARAAGFVTVGVFDTVSCCNEQEIRALSDVYIRSFAELLG